MNDLKEKTIETLVLQLWLELKAMSPDVEGYASLTITCSAYSPLNAKPKFKAYFDEEAEAEDNTAAGLIEKVKKLNEDNQPEAKRQRQIEFHRNELAKLEGGAK